VARKARIDGLECCPHVGAGCEPQHHIVERAVEIEGAAEGLTSHPQHAEPFRLRQHRAGCHREHEFRAARDADDLQHPLPAVDHRSQPLAG
jgi:hypothetical protein